jgi:Leucine-rich repeat (LRR) protein
VLLGLLLIPAALYGWQQYQDYGFRTAVAALAKDGYEVTRLSSGLLRLEVKEGASEMSLGLVSNAGIDLEELGEAMLCASYASPCSLTDPERIAHMTNVSDLDLRSTGLVSSEPLRRLTKLQSLNLSGNELTSVEPLQTLVALRKLDLSSNQLTSIEPLRNLKRFRS